MTKRAGRRLGFGPWSLLSVALFLVPARAAAATFDESVAALSQSTGADGVAHAAEAVAATGDPRALRLLQALSDGDALLCAARSRVVLRDSHRALIDAITGAAAAGDSCPEPDIDNEVRRVLDPLITRLELRSRDPAVRAAAVDDIAKSASDDDA